MTSEEFSNSFDTLLNSYNIQANFGETASKQSITLDEYEKSVLLTQAQDAIVKSYFDKTLNQQGQGFDDSARRQVDFSSLIMVKKYKNSDKLLTKPDDWKKLEYIPGDLNSEKENLQYEVLTHDDHCYDYRGLKVNLAPNILFMLNEKIVIDGRTYIVVPINYNEYDREMSKAYAQPLKKQAWRLFSNNSTGYDIQSEIIPIEGTFGEFAQINKILYSNKPKWSVSDETPPNFLSEHPDYVVSTIKDLPDIESIELNSNVQRIYNITYPNKQIEYTIRYVRRPTPIILIDLPNNLSIDGLSNKQECELNPILHMDILNKAFELAIATRGGGTAQRQQQESN